jgi:hypothetical protein
VGARRPKFAWILPKPYSLDIADHEIVRVRVGNGDWWRGSLAKPALTGSRSTRDHFLQVGITEIGGWSEHVWSLIVVQKEEMPLGVRQLGSSEPSRVKGRLGIGLRHE